MDSSDRQARVAELAKQLKLPTLTAYHDITDQLPPSATLAECLIALLERELEQRRANRARRLERQAGFPFTKSLDELDVSCYAGQLSPLMLGELGSCAFVGRRRNLLITGGTGRGKTHLAIGLGLRACACGRKVLFRTATGLVSQLKDDADPAARSRLWQRLRRADLLIIDELGYVRLDREESELLYQVVAERCERGSIIVTASLAPSAWTQCLADAALVEAMLDRLCHDVIRLDLQGPSWRLEQARKSAD